MADRLEYPLNSDSEPGQANGVQMPGPMSDGFEEGWAYGADYSNLFPDDAAIANMPEQVLPDDFNMGAFSQDVGLDPGQFPSYVTGLDSDASDTFLDQLSPDLAGGMDAMQGLANDSRPASLYNQDMYLSNDNPLDFGLVDPLDLQVQTEGN